MKIVLFFAMTETSLSDIYIAPLSYPWFLCSLCEPSTDQKYLEEKKNLHLYYNYPDFFYNDCCNNHHYLHSIDIEVGLMSE